MRDWPFWVGGAALAVVAVGYWRATGRLLGVSGSFARTLDGPQAPAPDDDTLLAAMLEATRAEFGDVPTPDEGSNVTPRRRPLPWVAHVALLAGLLVGGALAALTRGEWALHFDLGPTFARLVGTGWRAGTALAGGGLLVGFGTQMAGGCTSGHGLCGTSRLQRGSLVATAAFFGAAVVTSLLLERLS